MSDQDQDRCPFCCKRSAVALYPTYTSLAEVFEFRKCTGCRGIFLSPQPSPERLQEAYQESYYGEQETKFAPWVEHFIEFFRARRAERVARLLPKNGRILDLGCGNGRFLKQLADRGFSAHGIELPGKAAERAATISSINLKVGALQPGDFPQNHFDAISLWHVFEHLPNPRETLEVIAEILKPSGLLLLSLPNVESWQCRSFKGHWLHHDPPRHLFYFGAQDLEHHLGNLSFSLIRKSFFSIEQNPFGMQQSLLNIMLKRRDELYDALKTDKPVEEWSQRCSILVQKLFFVVTFPLFAALSILESLAGRGGTMELIFAKDRTTAAH